MVRPLNANRPITDAEIRLIDEVFRWSCTTVDTATDDLFDALHAVEVEMGLVDDDEDDTLKPSMMCATASHGGPYDDDAYVAGFEAANLAALLAIVDTGKDPATITPHRCWHTANVPQLDLIAMRAGWKLKATATGMPEWSYIALSPLTQTDPDQA